VDKVLSSGFYRRVVKGRDLWLPEILTVGVFFVCAILVFQGLWYQDRLATKKISDFENRILLVKQYFPKQDAVMKPLRQLKDADGPTVIVAIRRLAQNSGAAINRFALGLEEVVAKRQTSVLPMELSVVMPQKSLLAFVTGLADLDFLCRIVSLNVKPDTSNDENLRLSLKAERVRILKPPTQEVLRRSASDFKAADVRLTSAVAPGRKIFKNIVQPARRIIEAAVGAAEGLAISDLSLVGIIDDGVPKAVVEDKKASKTYYLVKDDEIGGMRVAEILEQEIVLEKAGTRYSLTL